MGISETINSIPKPAELGIVLKSISVHIHGRVRQLTLLDVLFKPAKEVNKQTSKKQNKNSERFTCMNVKMASKNRF